MIPGGSGISVKAEVKKWMGAISVETLATYFKPVLKRAFAIQAGGVRNQMIKVMKQDPDAEAAISSIALDEITKLLHRRGSFHKSGAITKTGIKRQKIGGVLAERKSIKITKLGPFSANIDWIEPLRPFASRFMAGGATTLANPRVRAAIHRALWYGGSRNVDVPAGATQPARPVTEPVATWANVNFERFIRGTVATLVADAIDNGKTLDQVGAYKRRFRGGAVSTLRHTRQRLRQQAARIAASRTA